MSFRSYLQTKLSDDAAGFYFPNHFLLYLDKDNPFIHMADENDFSQNNDFIDIFLHEYWHYWHNISTFSGIKCLSFSQDLLILFNRSLLRNGNGVAIPSSDLTIAEKSKVATLLELRSDHDGLPGPTDYDFIWNVESEFLGFTENKHHTIFQGKPASNTIISAVFQIKQIGSQPPVKKTFPIGSLAIEESVAYSVQLAVSENLLKDAPAPEFPYLVLERILQKEIGRDNTNPFVVASVGTLALCCTHPGPALVSIVGGLIAHLDKGKNVYEAIDLVKNSIQKNLRKYLGDIHKTLGKIESLHKGHGYVGKATAYLVEQCRKALSDRANDLLFDLAPFFPSIEIESFALQQNKYPPCDLLQQREGDVDQIERDIVLSFTRQQGDDSAESPGNWMRSLQAQQAYLNCHIDYSNQILLDTANINGSCPFYTMCNLETRMTKADVCLARPWETYKAGEPQCWYAHGVAATLGTVRLGQKKTLRKASATSRSKPKGKRNTMAVLQSSIEKAAAEFAKEIIAAVKSSTLQELLAMGGGAVAIPGRKRGRPPKAKKPGRKPGRPAKATAVKAPAKKTAKGKTRRKPGRPAKGKTRRKPGRPPKAKPGRKMGRPAKATAKKIAKKTAMTSANKKRSINYPKCSVPGCGKNRYARGNGMCGAHFRAAKAD